MSCDYNYILKLTKFKNKLINLFEEIYQHFRFNYYLINLHMLTTNMCQHFYYKIKNQILKIIHDDRKIKII